LEDLSSANVQLTRLNQLAHGLRETAETARRAKEEFVANVSHELRTPLNMIIGFSRMIVQNPHVYGKRAIPPALLADLTVILRNSQHLASLIDDVLDLSQIEADKMALSKERTDLKEIVETAVTVVRPLFESKRFYLETEIEEGLPALLVDRTRIREVLLNLLSNAGRFTEQGGVRVRVARVGADVRFSVADTGPGIAAADMSKLFQPFQQVDDSLRRRHEGTGLGLTLSKRFVELHGGRMWLESHVGQGSTFYFTLPLDAAPVAADGPVRWLTADWSMMARTRPSLAPAVDVPPRFVVLDGAGTLCRLATRYLDGCEIAPVSDLPAALKELAEAPAQALLVADPGALSWPSHQERLPAVASVPDNTPVILCTIPAAHPTDGRATGESATTLAPNALSTVAGYLVKPVSAEALLAAVTDSLRARDLNPDGPATVLLVDDEPDELRLFWRMLSATGRPYRVLTAGNGVEALEILRAERPDVVVSDLVMPEMDGFQLVAAKNAILELRDIPLVIISARDPQGQPIVAESVTAIRAGGLSIPQLLASIEALSAILSPLPGLPRAKVTGL
jgi:CheY-like chemotaxis protein/nitrogen-specific signal transduction histidine kinase